MKQTVNQWIVSETAQAIADVTAAIEALRFNEAAGAAYHFVYDIFCDWYVEITKPIFQGTMRRQRPKPAPPPPGPATRF